MLKLMRYWIELIFRRIKDEPLRFYEYVYYWTEAAKNPSDLGVSSKSVESDSWLELARAQYELLKWAGLKRNWTIVEIGCGNGKIPCMLKKDGANLDVRYFGLDIVEECIRYCRIRFRDRKNFHFEIIRDNKLDLKDNFADCIILMSVFTHVDENTIITYLTQIRRILRQKGVCIFTVHLAQNVEGEKRTVPVAQYSFDHMKKIIRDLGFIPYRFIRCPPPESEIYLQAHNNWPFGSQFYFLISKSEVNNLELTLIT